MRNAAQAYTAMRDAAAAYDESLSALLAHPDCKPGYTSADGSMVIVDNFAADNRVFRSHPARRIEVSAVKAKR
jgi:hypothetical protein